MTLEENEYMIDIKIHKSVQQNSIYAGSVMLMNINLLNPTICSPLQETTQMNRHNQSYSIKLTINSII